MTKASLTDGTSQEDRLVPALDDGYVDVDEMDFADLLAFAAEYAGLLKRGDGTDGDWKSFFRSDELSILAAILATDVRLDEAAFARIVAESGGMPRSPLTGRPAIESLPAFILAAKIDGWLAGLAALSSVAAVRAYERLADLVAKTLAREIQALYAFLSRIDQDAADRAFESFGPQWGLGKTLPAGGAGAEAQGDAFLWANFNAFRNAILYLQESVADLLPLSLGRHNHDPAIGLFVAFLKLFAKVQGRLNGFTRKHLTFYYADVLRISRREFVPDSAYLVLAPDVRGREVPIAQGTEFRAGLDENKVERIYAADGDLLVTDASVRSLVTLYLERNGATSPENKLSSGGEDAPQFVTAIKLNRLPAENGDAGKAQGEVAAQPLFGDPQRYGKKLLFEDARVGFAIASNVLLLKQGQRDIDLTFRLETAEPSAAIRPFVKRLSEILETTEADAFFKAFRHMFEISLTGETGWYRIAEYLPLCGIVDDDCEDDCFKIRLRLPDSAPAIVGYLPQLHGDGFDTELPIVNCTINPGAYLYPYSLVSEMIIREVVIDVNVTGCNGALVYNQLGPLSGDAQFAPFGTLPAQGDFLVVGCYEAARKRLTAFEVDVEWGGLSDDMTGFADYYRAYRMKFGNDEFKARLAVLRDRKWMPATANESPETRLFDSVEEPDRKGEAKLGRKRRFSFSGLCPLARPIENVGEDQYKYDAAAKDGFFRLTLSQPSQAFGHKDYPLVLSQVMTENAQLKRFGLAGLMYRRRAPAPLPNAPYTPLVNSILVNYKAVSTLSFERFGSADEAGRQEKFFHLRPLGQEVVSPNAHGRIHLVPAFDADGSLLIGISASRLAGTVALLFHLRQDSLPEAGRRAPGFAWHYLCSNEWKRLDETRVVSDTTNGFLASGIVTLDIPADIDRNNTALPADLFWLRVSSSDRQLRSLCSLYAVHANGLKVTWKRQEGNGAAHLSEGLLAGSIKEPKTSIVGLKEIRQIMDSSGGLPSESEKRWTTRVSERLKHKMRAVTAWDYERLVLENFPEIYKVKCFPCMTGREQDAGKSMPGHLLLVLIPYPAEGAAVNSEPMANALLLRDVGEFVRRLASPFATIAVRNPAYERIQVRCKVKLRRGREQGLWRNRLNREIVEYLSPWNKGGSEARFGWRIRCDEMQAHIQKLDYVETVTGLSLLRVRRSDDDKHRLTDTARGGCAAIAPSYPWGIAVPFQRHLVEIVDDRMAAPPVRTGIADLAIGSSFVLSGERQ